MAFFVIKVIMWFGWQRETVACVTRLYKHIWSTDFGKCSFSPWPCAPINFTLLWFKKDHSLNNTLCGFQISFNHMKGIHSEELLFVDILMIWTTHKEYLGTADPHPVMWFCRNVLCRGCVYFIYIYIELLDKQIHSKKWFFHSSYDFSQPSTEVVWILMEVW